MKANDRTPPTETLSACQRVSGDFGPFLAGPIVSERRKQGSTTKSHLKPMIWPTDIPKSDRLPTDVGRKSFGVVRRVPWNHMRREQRFVVKGNLLIGCEAGQILIERGPETVILRAGQAAILSDIEATVSELPLTRYEQGLFCYWHFTDRVLAELTSMSPRTASFIMTGADYDLYTRGMIPFGSNVIRMSRTSPERAPASPPNPDTPPPGFIMPPDFGPAPREIEEGYEQPHMLWQALILARNRMQMPFLCLCAEKVIIPRIRVLVFLENLTLADDDTHASLLEQFPGGKVVLQQLMRNLGMPCARSMVRTRRFELALAWHTYWGRTLPEIANALHVKHPKRFISDYQKWVIETQPFTFRDLDMTNYQHILLASSFPWLEALFGPYWRQREEQERNDAGLNIERDRQCQEIQDQVLEAWPDFYDEPCPELEAARKPLPWLDPEPGEIDEKFLGMENTGVRMAIAAYRISQIPGLEDVETLLTAA